MLGLFGSVGADGRAVLVREGGQLQIVERVPPLADVLLHVLATGALAANENKQLVAFTSILQFFTVQVETPIKLLISAKAL